MKKIAIIFCLVFFCINSFADNVKNYSTAGFHQLENSGRKVESMNPAWRFMLDPENTLKDKAFNVDFDDSKWNVVSIPNGLQELPVEASGGVNYRNGAWYRKTFTLSDKYIDKRLVLYFEAIMGKSKIWINGNLIAEHFGGYLPIALEIDKYIKVGEKNVITVWCDNSNDPAYPPGKPQETLDFCYFGGIYRDCWLISTNKNIYITDENMADKISGGGTFISYPSISEQEAIIKVSCDIVGEGKASYILKDCNNNIITTSKKDILKVENPNLWSPESPYLYNLEVIVKDKRGNIVDGYIKKIGIRSIAFSHKEGLILNGKKYPRKLIGANRHQDFAVVGNALSNNLHWRDAKKLKDAGMEMIRNAHYPQDPAFMDACDELGLFVIVNTPGWQFWNEDPIFVERVYDDIRNMVRRDRSRASVLLWEPILNETWYPADFAKKVRDIVVEELPGAHTAGDLEARGSEYFKIAFTHPAATAKAASAAHEIHIDTTMVYFTREFGDNVDDWNSHNSPSRVAREWGEIPQLIQAKHYANPPYTYTSIESLNNTPNYHFGGALWHSFDHQRGYHPDPFYGGIMDAFRRPKFSYYMFQAETNYHKPMVFIANEMTPFSPNDVTVFTNCETVRLRTFFGDTIRVKKKEGRWVTFENAYNFMESKYRSRDNKHSSIYILAEGLDKEGNVVATHRREMARRPVKLNLIVDTLDVSPVATGGDLVVVTAQMVDNNGNIKRLNNGIIKFEIEGEGEIVGNANYQTNPSSILWGEASILVRTTIKSGEIKVKASMIMEGENTPQSGEIIFNTQKPIYDLIYNPNDAKYINSQKNIINYNKSISDAKRNEISEMLREVEQQQEDFGEKQK